MADRWIPNIEEFFNSFCRVLVDGINLTEIEDDRAHYFARRITTVAPMCNTRTKILAHKQKL